MRPFSRARIPMAGAALFAAALVGGFMLWRGERTTRAPVNRTVAHELSQRRAVEAARARPTEDRSLTGQRTNADADPESLTYLAETSEDPRVIEASLREISSTYSSRSSRKRLPDAALDRALIKHVGSSQPSVAAAALAAARIPLMTKQPSDDLASAIIRLTAPETEPARRKAALEALSLIRPNRRSGAVLAAFESAFSASEPQVVSLALLALSQSGPSLETLSVADRTRIGQRVLELAAHGDPGVRGRSLAVLSEIEWLVSGAARFATAEQRFGDPHPYVRAQAVDLFRRCRQPMAIHRLIDAVGDLSAAHYELTGFTELDGTPGSVLHRVPGSPRVADAALHAILALGETVPGLPALVLALGGRPQPDSVVRDGAVIARAWYRAQRDRIPRTFVKPP